MPWLRDLVFGLPGATVGLFIVAGFCYWKPMVARVGGVLVAAAALGVSTVALGVVV